MKSKLTIATRQSPLALWQAHHVKSLLEGFHPGIEIELLGITTDGDRFLDTDLAKLGGKGVFVKALEEALINGTADIAVHSMKDVPVELPEGLSMPCISNRANVADAFVSNRYRHLADLPSQARIGTSSLRRHSQLKYYRPDFTILPLRGNIQTRLQKLDEGQYDAIILAAAGLERMSLNDRICHLLDYQLCLPAVGQGALGIECRTDDLHAQQLLQPLNHLPTHLAVLCERQVNLNLGGNCHAPIGALAVWENQHLSQNQNLSENQQLSKIQQLSKNQPKLHLQAMVANASGTKKICADAYLTADTTTPIGDFLQLANRVTDQLKQQGALALLADHA